MGKVNQVARQLSQKIQSRTAKVAVIGLGYVGLPLAVEFARSGFPVLGIDKDKAKAVRIKRGILDTRDVNANNLKALMKGKKLWVTTNVTRLGQCDCIIICVPTPLNKVKEPDISFVLDAARAVRNGLRKGQLVILESTVYPGTTEEIVLSEIARDGFEVGRDFFLCFSPERIDPGNREYPLSRIPKVVGGITESCTRLAVALYRHVVDEVVPVSSPRVAELSKLLENTFRVVNIGLMNELVPVAHRLNVNIWEAIEAARTKPFGYMPFYPGPGIGGHCIGIDPLYLSWKAKLVGSELRFIELASRINASMPGHVVRRAIDTLNAQGKTIKGDRNLILGVSSKRDVGDIRESPALEIIQELLKRGARVQYHDPFVKILELESAVLRSRPLTAKLLRNQDLIILITDHTCVNYGLVAKKARLILDTRNALSSFKKYSSKIVLL